MFLKETAQIISRLPTQILQGNIWWILENSVQILSLEEPGCWPLCVKWFRWFHVGVSLLGLFILDDWITSNTLTPHSHVLWCDMIGYQVSLVVGGSSSRSDDHEKLSPVGSSNGYQRFMRCRYSSASGGFRLLVPSDRAVICCAKPLRNYPLSDFIINKLILYYYVLIFYSWYRALTCQISWESCTQSVGLWRVSTIISFIATIRDLPPVIVKTINVLSQIKQFVLLCCSQQPPVT